MIWRKTLISLLIFAGLVALYTTDYRWTQRRREAKDLSARLFPISKKDVAQFTIVTPEEIITIKRDPAAGWRMTQPLQVPADDDQVTVTLDSILDANRFGEFKVDETVSLADYGFESPTYKFAVQTRDGKNLTLLVGNQAPQSGRFFAKLDNESKVFSIPDYTRDKLHKKPFDFRDRAVLALKPDRVRELAMTRDLKLPVEVLSMNEDGTTKTTSTLERKPERIVVARADGDRWMMQAPVRWRGDPTEMTNLLTKLNTSKVASFLDKPTTANLGFDKPQIDLQVTQRTTQRPDREGGTQRPDREGGTGDTKTTGTAAATSQTLRLLVGDHATSPLQGYYAKRADGSVVVIATDAFDALSVRASRLRDRSIFTIPEDEVAYLEVQSARGEPVALEKNDAGQWVFTKPISGATAAATTGTAASEAKTTGTVAADAKTTGPAPAKAEAKTTATVETAEADLGTSIDQVIVAQKVTTMVELKAVDFETDDPKDLSKYRLDKPFVRITLANKDRSKVEGLDIGELATRNEQSIVFAKRREIPTIFQLDFTKPSQLVLTRRELLQRTLLHFKSAEVQRVEVTSGTTAFTLTNQAGAWRLQRAGAEQSRRVSNVLVGGMLRGLSDLKFESVYKGPLTEQEMGLTSPPLQVVLYGEGDKEIARVIRGAERGARFYTRTQPAGPIYGVEAGLFRIVDSAIRNLVKE